MKSSITQKFLIKSASLLFLLSATFGMAAAQCPVATVTGPKDLCPGASVKLSSASSLPGSGNIIAWEWWVNGSRIPGENDSTLTIKTEGTYQVKVTNSKKCSTMSGNYSVSYKLDVKPVISGSHDICSGSSLTLSGMYTLSSGKTSYQWKLNGADVKGANQVIYTINTPGTYSLKATNSSGCSAVSDSFVVNQVPAPTVSATASATSFCTGGNVQLTANPSVPAGVTATYQWTLNGTAIQGATSSTLNVTSGGNYKMSVSASNGCRVQSNTLTISENQLPSVTVDGTAEYCSGGAAELVSSVTPGNNPVVSYAWSMNGNTIAGASASRLAAGNTGDYTVEVTDAAGCKAVSAKHSLSLCAVPNVKISGSNTFCSGTTAPLQLNISSYSGIYLAGVLWTVNGQEIGSGELEIQAEIPGDYSAMAFFSCGCSTNPAPDFTVTEVTSPVSVITGSNTFCSGSTASLSAASSTPGSGSIISYQWQLNGADIQGATGATYDASAPGNYTLIITDSNGCTSTSATFTVTNPC